MAEDVIGQDYIRRFFGDRQDGYVIDVGAHAGIKYGSMSWELVQRGWGGLLVEPLPNAFGELTKNYQHSPSVTCVQAACSDTEGEATLYPHKGVSTLNADWAKACEQWWKHIKYKPSIRVRKVRLDSLLRQVNAPTHIDFLQVDTEGHDFQVLKGMDWGRQPDLVCVETLDVVHPERKLPNGVWGPDPEMNQFLQSLGYALELLTPGGNGFYVRRKND